MEVALPKPTFIKPDNTTLFKSIKHEVNTRVASLQKERTPEILIKAIFFPLCYFLLYLTALRFGKNIFLFFSCYCLMGCFIVFNFFNLIHEAVHNALFKNKHIDQLYLLLFDLFGANSYIWKVRHTRLHHNYPNIKGWDSDLEQSPLARIFPHGGYTKIHRYQHVYLPMFYLLFILNWLLVRDFKDFFNRQRMVWRVVDIPTFQFVKLIFFKAFFIFYIIVLPVIILHLSIGVVITAFVILALSSSILSLIVLLSPHANVQNNFPELDHEGVLHFDWLTHQLSSTNDITEDNWFTRYFMGSFNYHISHHLFPNINHVYYREVTAIVKRHAQANHLPFRSYPLLVSLKYHYELLKRNSVHENIFEETL